MKTKKIKREVIRKCTCTKYIQGSFARCPIHSFTILKTPIFSGLVCEKCKKERKIYAKGLCKSCYNQKRNKKNPNFKENCKRWRQKNPEYFTNYYKNMPKEQKEKILKKAREYQKEYYKNNPEQIKKNRREYYKKHIEKINIYQAEYRKKMRERNKKMNGYGRRY